MKRYLPCLLLLLAFMPYCSKQDIQASGHYADVPTAAHCYQAQKALNMKIEALEKASKTIHIRRIQPVRASDAVNQ